jgi:hypothetical protein
MSSMGSTLESFVGVFVSGAFDESAGVSCPGITGEELESSGFTLFSSDGTPIPPDCPDSGSAGVLGVLGVLGLVGSLVVVVHAPSESAINPAKIIDNLEFIFSSK